MASSFFGAQNLDVERAAVLVERHLLDEVAICLFCLHGDELETAVRAS